MLTGPSRATQAQLLTELRETVAGAVGASPEQLAGHSFGGLGGSSLDAARVVVRLRESWGLRVDPQQLLRAPDLDRLLCRVAEPERDGVETPRPEPAHGLARADTAVAADAGLVPLSWQQRVIWYQSMLDPGSTRYHFYALLHFDSLPPLGQLRELLARQLTRHPALRVRLSFADGQPWQQLRTGPVTAAELDLIEVRLPARPDSPEELVAAVGADAAFDLDTGPLLRWRLAVFPDGQASLVHAEHHLIHDGRSFQAFLHTLDEGADAAPDPRYLSYAGGQSPPDPAAVAQAAAELRQAGQPLFEQPPTGAPSQDRFLRLPVPDDLLAAVRTAARQASTTLFSGLFAAFGQALAQHQDQPALVVGSAVDNRPAGHEDTVGMFVSTVPVPVERQGDEPYEAVVRRADRALAAAIRRSDLPLPELVAALGGEAGRGGDALVRAAFSMHQQPEQRIRLAGQWARVELGVFNGAAKFPVNVVALATGTGDQTRVTLLMEAAAPATVDDLWALWTLMMRWLREWVGRPVEPGPDDQLARQVRAHAGADDRVAIRDSRESLTYRQLVAIGDAASERLGWRGQLVGILGTASTGFFGCAYAAVHAGGSYLPLPADRPVAALAEVATRAGCAVLVDTTGVAESPALARLRQALPAAVVLDWRDIRRAAELAGPAPAGSAPAGSAPAGPAPIAAGPATVAVPVAGAWSEKDDEPPPAYLIFTSGSTGKPKGVVVGRGSLGRLAGWAREELGLAPGTVMAQTASVSFDASVLELWSSLSAGAELRIAPADLRADPHRLAGWLETEQIECAFIGTPIAELLFSLAGQPSRLRAVATGGDRLHPVPTGLPYRVINMYGPTECTVVATAGLVRPGDEQLPPIGRPLPYARVRVVTAAGEPAGVGQVGELLVGGGGLARGYLGDRRLTATRFVADPYDGWGEPAYRTGDLVRQRPDGQLDFVGRDDRQVQIGGVRTELGEIEAAALRQPEVSQAVAVAGIDGLRSWVKLFVVAGVADRSALAGRIRAALPPHLRHLPVQPVPELPLTSSGKVDLAALAAAAGAGVDGDGNTAGAADILAPILAQLPDSELLALAHRLLGSVLDDDHRR